MPHRRRIHELALLSLGGLACVALGCDSQASSADSAAANAGGASLPVVAVVTAKQHPWPRTVRVQGSLVPDEEAVIGAKVAGRVRRVVADRGTVVKLGDVLAELEMEEFDLQVREAEAQVEAIRAKLGLRPGVPDEALNPKKAPPVVQEQAVLDEARLNVERARSLVRQNATAVEEVQKAEAALQVAEARYASSVNNVQEQIVTLGLRRAELAIAVQRQADATLRAPFPGVIQERRAASGTYLKVGDPVAVLVRVDPLRFRAGVPEREAARIRLGEEVAIVVEGEGQPLAAKISRCAPALDMTNRALLIEADVPNPSGQFRGGLFAQAEIVVDAKGKTLAVPITAVVEFAGVEKVWVVRDGKAEDRRVVTGRRRNDLVEIVVGLKTGEQVVREAVEARAGPVQAVVDQK